MKKMYQLVVVLISIWQAMITLHATINFGSADSCIMVAEGTLDLGSAHLSDGLIRDASGAGLVMTSAECTRMTLEIDNVMNGSTTDVTKIVLDGTLSLGGESLGTIVLEPGDSLKVAGANLYQTVYMNGSEEAPSMLEGTGFVNFDIVIHDSAYGIVSWDGPLNASIYLGATAEDRTTALILDNNLTFAPFSMITACDTDTGTNEVRFNGFKMLFGGDEDGPTIIHNSHQWVDANIQLTGPALLASNKTIFARNDSYMYGDGNAFIFGTGASLNFDDATASCENIVLQDYAGGCVLNGRLECNHVTFIAIDGRSVTLEKGAVQGARIDPFDGDADFDSGHIVLNSDLSILGTWTFSGDTIIDGNGFHLDISGGTLHVNNAVTVILRNVILDNVQSSSLAGTGTLNLSNVTLIVNSASEENIIDWSSKTPLVIDGPVTFITGLKGVSVAQGSTINNVTAYYDTLGASDEANVSGFTGTGFLQWVDATGSVLEGSFTVIGNSRLQKSIYLYPDLVGTNPCTISFAKAGGGSIQYDGRGRTLFCPRTTLDLLSEGESEAVFFVADGTHVYTQNITIDGFKPAHVSFEDVATTSFVFGDSTFVILREDLTGESALEQVLLFGSSSRTGQDMILDLNGGTIDLQDDSAAIVLQGAGSSSLRIRNGRLLHVSGSKIRTSNGNTIIFDSVEILLAGDTAFSNGGFRIEGASSVYGVRESVLTVRPHTDSAFTIAPSATFTVCDGITYEHESIRSVDFVLEGSDSSFVLIGGLFKRTDVGASAPLILKRGVLVIDHTSYLNAGTQGITFGDGLMSEENLKIEFRPGATLTVLEGSVAYNNVELGGGA